MSPHRGHRSSARRATELGTGHPRLQKPSGLNFQLDVTPAHSCLICQLHAIQFAGQQRAATDYIYKLSAVRSQASGLLHRDLNMQIISAVQDISKIVNGVVTALSRSRTCLQAEVAWLAGEQIQQCYMEWMQKGNRRLWSVRDEFVSGPQGVFIRRLQIAGSIFLNLSPSCAVLNGLNWSDDFGLSKIMSSDRGDTEVNNQSVLHKHSRVVTRALNGPSSAWHVCPQHAAFHLRNGTAINTQGIPRYASSQYDCVQELVATFKRLYHPPTPQQIARVPERVHEPGQTSHSTAVFVFTFRNCIHDTNVPSIQVSQSPASTDTHQRPTRSPLHRATPTEKVQNERQPCTETRRRASRRMPGP